jgi:hypothetical protein
MTSDRGGTIYRQAGTRSFADPKSGRRHEMARKTTGKKAARAASDTLRDKRTSKKSKSAAASALSQVEKRRKR